MFDGLHLTFHQQGGEKINEFVIFVWTYPLHKDAATTEDAMKFERVQRHKE